MRQRICHLLHSLHVGGAEVLAARLGRQFAHEYDLIYVCLDELGSLGEELRRAGFAVHVVGRGAGVDWKCAARLGLLLRRERINLIHAHQYTPFFYASAARWLYRRPAILFLEHGRHQPDYPRRKRIVINKLLLERRDRVIGVGAAVRHALIDNEGIPKHRVDVIYNGIKLDGFSAVDRNAVRGELGLVGDTLALFQVARFDPIKDHGTALRAFARLLEHFPNARLFLIGDGPERQNIEKLINGLGLSDRVHLLGERGDVPRLLSAADVFMLTSKSEGIPLTIIEAMAASLAVVATSVGGVPEVVLDGSTGLLAPPGDSTALAAQLCRLASDPVMRSEMGRRGRCRAEAEFSENDMVESYAKIYRTMLGEEPRFEDHLSMTGLRRQLDTTSV